MRLHGGIDLPLRLWNGRRLGPADPSFLITLRDPGSLRAMLWPPSDMTAGKAYLNGAVEVEGDLLAAIGAGERLGRMKDGPWWRTAVVGAAILALPAPPEAFRSGSGRAQLQGAMHSRERDRQAIAFHYDLPSAFYETFLDRELVYSCAYFDTPMGDLDLAQRRKLDLVCRKLRLEPGQRLLDVGCGFGSLLLHAARDYGVTGLGVTLSQTQAETAQKLIAEAGLSDRIEVRLMDYRDVDERFDVVASIGMIEHVGPEHLPGWFAAVRASLKPGGLLLCHGITLGDADHVRRGDEETFVTGYVFPDGGLVPAWQAVRDLQQAGFGLLDVEQLRPHYAWTLRRWLQRLEAHRERAVEAGGQSAFRTWRMYMAGSAYSFETGSLEVVQLLGRAPGGEPADLPLGRTWMEPHIS
ncbi:MAG: class I SAM-dependent methyltransferase [Egibacteraceae bacterium]